MSCPVGSTSVYHASGLSPALETVAAGVTKSYRAKSLAAASETECAGVISNYHALGLTPAQEVTSAAVIGEYCGIMPTSITAKSVIFDISDNYGATGVGVRSIDFVMDGVKIPLLAAVFTADATTEEAATNAPDYTFDTSTIKTGSYVNNCWLSDIGTGITQRILIVFDDTQSFDEIIINNFHNNGGLTTYGAKNVAITISSDAITDTTYNAAIANSTVLSGVAVFLEHTASNVEDDQTVWTF